MKKYLFCLVLSILFVNCTENSHSNFVYENYSGKLPIHKAYFIVIEDLNTTMLDTQNSNAINVTKLNTYLNNLNKEDVKNGILLFFSELGASESELAIQRYIENFCNDKDIDLYEGCYVSGESENEDSVNISWEVKSSKTLHTND